QGPARAPLRRRPRGPVVKPRLSTDLDFFFAPDHFALPAELPALAPAVASTTEPADIVACLGRHSQVCGLVASEIGIDLRSVCLVREALGYASPLADSIFAVHGLGTHPIVLGGTA